MGGRGLLIGNYTDRCPLPVFVSCSVGVGSLLSSRATADGQHLPQTSNFLGSDDMSQPYIRVFTASLVTLEIPFLLLKIPSSLNLFGFFLFLFLWAVL